MCEAAQTLLRWKSIAWMFIVREEQLSNVLNFNLNFFFNKRKANYTQSKTWKWTIWARTEIIIMETEKKEIEPVKPAAACCQSSKNLVSL